MIKKKKILIIGIFIILTLLLIPCYLKTGKNTLIVAHRGGRIVGVENTKDAYLEAIRLNAKYLETDIVFTKDNIPVLFHDETLDDFIEENSALRGIDLRELNFSDIKDVIIKEKLNGKIYESKICTYDEFLSLCKQYRVNPVVEIKNDISDKREQLDIIVEKIKEYGLYQQTIVISFELDNLLYLREKYQDLNMQWVCKSNVWDNIDICIEQNIHIDVNWLHCTKKLVKYCHDNNLKINVWTVNIEIHIYYYQRLGVDFITTDRKMSW